MRRKRISPCNGIDDGNDAFCLKDANKKDNVDGNGGFGDADRDGKGPKATADRDAVQMFPKELCRANFHPTWNGTIETDEPRRFDHVDKQPWIQEVHSDHRRQLCQRSTTLLLPIYQRPHPFSAVPKVDEGPNTDRMLDAAELSDPMGECRSDYEIRDLTR